MVMTTKHHEGFCHFDSQLTNYCAPKQGPGRDLVKEYVEAARGEGMRVGFYYSLMDWHHPDGARCATDEAARRRFVDYIHGQIRELLSNYGKIDVLWYDVSWPLDAAGWESEKMNAMVFDLQPEIIVNNRNALPGDFATPEQRITADQRAWESCMTMNDSWGYQRGGRQLEIAEDHCPQLSDLRARYGELPAEYRAQGGWLDSGRVGEDTDLGGKVDGPQWRDHLPERKVPAGAIQLRELFAQGEHAVYARSFLAGVHCIAGWTAKQGDVGPSGGGRQGSEIRSGRFPRPVHGTTGEGSRRTRDHARD